MRTKKCNAPNHLNSTEMDYGLYKHTFQDGDVVTHSINQGGMKNFIKYNLIMIAKSI